MPPLLHAASAAHRRAVHGLEDRMSSHRYLLAVVPGLGGAELLPHEVLGMATDRLKSDAIDVGEVIRRELEAAPELASRKLRECVILGHDSLRISKMLITSASGQQNVIAPSFMRGIVPP